MDAKGISRKKWKFTYSPNRFIKIKAILILLIPLVYMLYSPLLFIVMLLYVGLFYLAIGTERSMNKSVIKSNHIKIPKYDSAIALLLVVIALLGSIFGVSNGRIGRFSNTIWSKITTSMTNFGSLLTGQRTLFGSNRGFGFGTAPKPPDGFVANASELSENMGDMPRGGGGRPDFDIDITNIPIEFMFSQILSTVQTALIFLVVGVGIFSLWITYKKMKKFEIEINEIVLDGDIHLITDEHIDKIISFGEDEII
ncbi:hypothetical protein KHQ89_02375 [Mycoplasmatota bacterium]|nr:hypothetical protein KHQ89_02375 [Mycoplasmatota bacterium]